MADQDTGMTDKFDARARQTQFTSWIHWLAFGLGSGTAPKAPGTAGSAAALLFLPVFAWMSWPVQIIWVVATLAFGIWLCGRTARDLKVHDHPGIVWDEFVGIWIVFIAVPLTWSTVLIGFVLFRFFDVLKPWPIRWLDKHLKGGTGIMLDDVLAGFFALVLIHIWLLTPWATTLMGG